MKVYIKKVEDIGGDESSEEKQTLKKIVMFRVDLLTIILKGTFKVN